jgi:hypothetical protein
MEHEENRPVRKNLINVEQESVEKIFQQRPDEISKKETWKNFRPRFKRDIGKVRQGKQRILEEVGEWTRELEKRTEEEVCGNRGPEQGHDVPLCPCAHLR